MAMGWSSILLLLSLVLAQIAASPRELTVKILTQRRQHSLQRLVSSLETAHYLNDSIIDVEIFVDGLPNQNSWLWNSNEARRAEAERSSTLGFARDWAASGRWHLGEVTVVDSTEWRGIRGSWLACSNPELTGEEFRRFIVLEDDVELSSVWFEYLKTAIDRYAKAESLAGISLQRQAGRLDLTAKELGDTRKKKWRQGANEELAPLNPELDGDQVYLFPHVGSWGFAPEPRIWAAFLRWYNALSDPNDVDTWSLGTDGQPRSDTERPFFEALPSRWYRSGLSRSRGELGVVKGGPMSMWTAHFDVFCSLHGLFVLHPHFEVSTFDGKRTPVALAASWREDGEHFQSISSIDTTLLKIDDWYLQYSNRIGQVFPQHPPVITFSGQRLDDAEVAAAQMRYNDRFLRRHIASPSQFDRRLLLDADWQLDEALLISDLGSAAQGAAFGYSPLRTVSIEEAYCILDGMKIVIFGDSISRYFTFTLNYFLKHGIVSPEFGDVNGGCETWGCATRTGGVWTDSEYFDRGEEFGSGTDRSTFRNHKQHITATFNEGAIQTDFYFITDTWYDELATLAQEIRSTHQIAIVNSGWWEFIESEDDHGGTACEDAMRDISSRDVSPFYTSEDCLEAYESDLNSMVNGLLRDFAQKSQNGEGAAIWRQSICCGFDITSSQAIEIQRGSIAVQALNAVAERVMLSDNGIEVVNVSPFHNLFNTGNGDPDDPSGRTWDGSHPRARYNFLWLQVILNNIAKQLDRTDSCLVIDPTPAPTEAPSRRPTTAAPIGLTCDNGIIDGDETDIDCGGSGCPGCGLGGTCAEDSDCASNSLCTDSECIGAPSAYPTSTAPTSAVPTYKPSPIPTSPPVPFPTRSPTRAEDRGSSGSGGGGNGYGNEDNVRQEAAFSVGNVTFNCFPANDGVTYEISRFAFDHCPTGGQKLLLAALVAVLVSHIYAYAFLQGSSSPESAKASRATKTGSTSNVRLEDELSGSALRVLKHMETMEGEIKSVQSPLSSPQPMHSHHRRTPLESVQEEKADADIAEIELGHMNQNERVYARNGYPHTSFPRDHMNSAMSRGTYNQHQPNTRTNISLINRSLAYSGHNHRATTFTEPHLQSHGHRSSVAFSLYDCGDSDDDDDDEIEEVAPLHTDSRVTGDAEQAAVVPSSQKVKRGKTYAATSTAIGFAILLGICVLGEKAMPSGLLPAATVSTSENIDLFTFILASLFLISLINIEELDDGSDVFLSRAQANEWKGWMQVAFVAYHYTNAQDVYVPIRWAVSAYVWLTGFGNGVFFWSVADFSFLRFIQQIWRMNFLAIFLSLATGTPWIEYYFVALANVHFVIIFLSLGVARLVGTFVPCLWWPKPDRKNKIEACTTEKLFGVCLVLLVDLSFWLIDDRGDGKGAYDTLLRPWLIDISEYTEWYFYLRTNMDYLSSLPGLVFAIWYSKLRDSWPGDIGLKWLILMYVVAVAMLIAAIQVASLKKYCCDNGAEYRKVNAYVGTLWIPFYLLVRNARPWLSKRVAKPIEWIGMHSLEFYLLQFHVFLTHQSKRVLYIIPHEDWGLINMAITGFIYICMSAKALELTNALRSIAWRASKPKVIVTGTWCVLGYVLLADRWSSTKCDAYTWTLWTVLTLVAVIFLLLWTVTT